MEASHYVRISFIFTVALGFVQSAFACSCLDSGSAENELKRSTAVFSGKAIDVDSRQCKTTFEIYRYWKGVSTKTIVVFSSHSLCGYFFTKDKEYLVYAFGDKRLSTNICTGTKELSQAKEDLEKLGEGTEVQESDEK
jgi:hypothetical protein